MKKLVHTSSNIFTDIL